ncbi:putative defense protein 3 [Spea bombifrons]|uniref:putative defense protein 3 n=1 Tax=Spea bombifrons TaxID=233779 RepID=UPI00234A4022|nr:putative defense protein 3 [Spea bombifrons]
MILFVLSKILILITLVKMSSQYPNGAPISVCQTMIPGHQGIFPQPNPAPYIFKISSTSYKNGKPIRVQILGPGYRGLLLESRTYDKTMLIGKWVFPPNDTKILQCPENSAGAITHSNTNLKTQSTTYTWMPPEEDCPPIIFFIATVAESHDVYWLGVKSAAIWKGKFNPRK